MRHQRIRASLPRRWRFPPSIDGLDADGDTVEIKTAQSYIISVTYNDDSDATGEESSITDSAIFTLGNAVLSTDATEYTLEQTAFVELVDYDRNYDSDTREVIQLSEIDWEGNVDVNLANTAFDASPPFLRETEANSGIFLTEITIPEEIKEDENDASAEPTERGSSVSLSYTDDSPAGTPRPNDDDRSVETSFTILTTGASLTLDKDVYSWRDRVTLTVVAPDFNIDPLAVEFVGMDDDKAVNARSQIDEIEGIRLTETGPNTGLFQGTIDLGGIKGESGYTVASGVVVTCSETLEDTLCVSNEDGISVTFTYDEDERDLVQSALIRWSVAEVTWLEDELQGRIHRHTAGGRSRQEPPSRHA